METARINWKTYLYKVLILAALYFGTGYLGLLLAVPPGYATIIWPPSGIAIGFLLSQGKRHWPGIFLGSMLINLYISGISISNFTQHPTGLLAAFCIAIGSTLQAYIGSTLSMQLIGHNLKFDHLRTVIMFIIIMGPLTCLVAATVGTLSLYYLGFVSATTLPSNWLTWWCGDMFGVLVFLPLILFTPSNHIVISWKGNTLGRFSFSAIIILMTPLILTFYAWKIASENIYLQAKSQFESMVAENRQAIQESLSAYRNALVGAAAFFEASDDVKPNEWNQYVQTLDIKKNFPGMNGLGWIKYLEPLMVNNYVKSIQTQGMPLFYIHPQVDNNLYFIITYIFPLEGNSQALGLNIAFEANRRNAALLAGETGQTTLTQRIQLVQDENRSAGFLVFHPVYNTKLPLLTTKQRLAALEGWVYAPLKAEAILMTARINQRDRFQLKIFDGKVQDDSTLIYSTGHEYQLKPAWFKKVETIEVLQKQWTLVWESTPAFENLQSSLAPVFILAGGLLFSTILGLFLIVNSLQDYAVIETLAGRKKYLLPTLVIIFSAILSFLLYLTLNSRENEYIRINTNEDLKKLILLLKVKNFENILAIKRMTQRWETSAGTPYNEWKNDATNYINQMAGLKAMEWVDNHYQVRWVVPEHENNGILGLNILYDKSRNSIIKQAQLEKLITITPPVDVLQGYKAFLVYAPLFVKNNFDGYIVAIFSIDQLIRDITQDILNNNYNLIINYKNNNIYTSSNITDQLEYNYSAHENYHLFNQAWDFSLIPTHRFIHSKQTLLPIILLFTGILIGTLLALNIQFMFASRLKSRILQLSEETFRTAMENAPIGMALVSPTGKWLKVNKALCNLLGYTADELLASDFQTITHAEDLDKDLALVQKTIQGEITSYQMEKRYISKTEAIIYVLLSVSLVRKADGSPDYFISQIQDITQQKQAEKIKDEFVSTVSHELRTPLTSIRGSLGLILGKMAEGIAPKVINLIDIAYKNCDRLILLINDILDIDKIASGRMRFDLKDENLANLITQAQEANQAYAEKFQTFLRISPIDRNIFIKVDSSRFIQVLNNLLSNAAKFSHANEPIDVIVEKFFDKVKISVKDYGVGINKKFAEQIFSKFAQADSSANRKKGGTGLGLHITKQIVEKMAGNIGFSSEEGKGSTFWLEFPYTYLPSCVAGTQLSPVLDPALPTILHIEDDIYLSNMLGEGLRSKAQLVAATLLRDAEYLLQKYKFDLILLDIAMPDGDGLSMLTKFHSLSNSPPIVILSARDVSDEFKSQVAEVLVKSQVSEQKVLDTILRLLKLT